MIAKLVSARTIPSNTAATLSRSLVSRAREHGQVFAAGAIVTGPAILLGSRQRASRVLAPDFADAVPVARRASSGTHVFIRERSTAALFVIALPTLTALVADTRGPTVLNRNVRGWLTGLVRHGAFAQYYGHEWISVQKQPFGLLALTGDARGAIAIELWVGIEHPVELDASLASSTHRHGLRRHARAVACWNHFASDKPLDLARIDGIQSSALARYDCAVEPVSAADSDQLFDEATLAPRPEEPPADARWFSPSPSEIGWIDVARAPSGALWVGGDALVTQDASDAIEATFARPAAERAALLRTIVDESIALGVSPECWLDCGAAVDDGVVSTPS
ncbi:MAG: hypothetical protein JNK05_03775 [Myxococcales bacterium]|nr:hypothetical protein [Myxococcales bacterium]